MQIKPNFGSKLTSKLAIETPVLDAARFQALLDLDDTVGFFSELRATFVDDVGKNLADLRTSLQQNNFAETARLAHKIKGLSSNLGFERLAQGCIALEGALNKIVDGTQSPEAADFKPLAQQLAAHFADAITALDRFSNASK